MLVKFDMSALSEIKPHEYITRFLLGGLTCVATGLIAQKWGPVVGGLFLAFPAIFPASATLVEKHELERKGKAGIAFTFRGRLSAALDARGAVMGALALGIFAFVAWKELPSHHALVVLGGALAAWLLLASGIWRLRRSHTRIWIIWRARRSKAA
jgi:Protein of unknown function (DUF3147)